MKRLLPSSFSGQMALLLGLALLVAQLINFALILNDRQKLTLARSETPAITRFVSAASDLISADPEFRGAVLQDNSHRGARFSLSSSPGIPDNQRDADLEERVLNALGEADLTDAAVRAVRSPAPARQGMRRSDEVREQLQIALQLSDGSWMTGLLQLPPRDPLLTVRLAASNLLLYLFVLAAAIFGTHLLLRPLADLTRAAHQFARRSAVPPLHPRGPGDLREAMLAFNGMNERISALLDEKDHLLGAIGHDLRTPLASLRIRVESMEPMDERYAAIAKIEEMATMLEDVLVLARTGRSRAEMRPIDIVALVEALTDEYYELGRQVSFEPIGRYVALADASLLRRALRNLIDNALTYGTDPLIRIDADESWITVSVADIGPGVAPEDLCRIIEPFQRLESSRSRSTGGSGLGLAITRSIIESHGGSLSLAPNLPNGLVAKLSLPSVEAKKS